MGFKCPVCKKDFGTKKEEFQKHLDLENYKIDLNTLSYINSSETFMNVLAVENEILSKRKKNENNKIKFFT